MNRPAHCRLLNRFTTSTVALAVVLPGSLLALTESPASAAPLPAAYSADAHADIVDLDLDLLGEELAGIQVGHSRSSVTSTPGGGTSTGTSANLGGALAGTDLVLDEETVTAPPTANPVGDTLLPVNLAPVATVGAVTGDVEAAWTSASSCVPADANGVRVLSDARTTLAGVELASLPLGLGTLADVGTSETRTRTFLDDAGPGGSDVVSRATTTIGDISLLGNAVTVDVTSPVVLEARSDGTTGSAAYANPPTVAVTVGTGPPVTLPSNGQPQPITLPVLLDTLVNLTVTAYPVQDQSSGATGQATVDALLRIDLEVLDVGVLDAATVSLGIAPMAVGATAPTGGVECDAVDEQAPASPVIDTPVDGSTTTDTTPEFSGTAEPGSTVVVRDSDGTEICSDVADPTTGAWSCTPSTPLPQGQNPYTATAEDEAGNESGPATTTFTVDTTGPAVTVLTPADGSTTSDVTPEVTGNGEAGATIEVTENGLPVCSTTVQQDGSWSCTPTLPLLPDGHTFTVTAEDAAGNQSTDTTTFTIVPSTGDTAPPTAPDITSPSQGASVQDTTPLISGTGEAGATVTVKEGATVLCTAVVNAGGTWSCSPTVALPLGPHTVTATQTDADGNTSPADSTTFTIAADSAGPVSDDPDGDGLPNGGEAANGTNPANPDTDGDGLTDGAEVNTHGTDPLVKDTDKDGLTDGQEVTGVKIRERFRVCGQKARRSITVTTNPLRKDTDKDGLGDGKEVTGYTIKQRVKTRKGSFVIGRTRSNPTKKDTDRDGLKDKVEVTGKANKLFGKAKSDPSTCDTDQGGVRDGAEVRARSNPSDVRSGPRRPMGRIATSDALPSGMG